MVKNRKPTGTASSIPAGIAFGVLISMIITLLGTAISAYLVHSESIRQESIGYASMAVLLVSGAVGALTAINRIKRMRLQMCLLSGACYFLVLLSVTALFFGGQYAGVGATGLTILIGCGSVAALSVLLEKKGSTHRRNKAYR